MIPAFYAVKVSPGGSEGITGVWPLSQSSTMSLPYKRFFTEVLQSDLLLRGAGGAAFVLHNAETWRPYHYAMWVAFVLGGKVGSPLACNFPRHL